MSPDEANAVALAFWIAGILVCWLVLHLASLFNQFCKAKIDRAKAEALYFTEKAEELKRSRLQAKQ